MLIAVEGDQHFIHEDLAFVIQRLFEVGDPECMLDIVISANAMNFHGGSPKSECPDGATPEPRDISVCN